MTWLTQVPELRRMWASDPQILAALAAAEAEVRSALIGGGLLQPATLDGFGASRSLVESHLVALASGHLRITQPDLLEEIELEESETDLLLGDGSYAQSASTVLASHLGVSPGFGRRPMRSVWQGFGGAVLQLRLRPVEAIVSVAVDDVPVPPEEYTLAKGSGLLRRPGGWSGVVTVEFWGGYHLGPGAAPAGAHSPPALLVQAAQDFVAHRETLIGGMPATSTALGEAGGSARAVAPEDGRTAVPFAIRELLADLRPAKPEPPLDPTAARAWLAEVRAGRVDLPRPVVAESTGVICEPAPIRPYWGDLLS